jgi:hypothetical protein
MKTLTIISVLILSVAPPPAYAQVERYALAFGNNVGERDERNLRYAEKDAAKLVDVLMDLGRVPSQNIVLLRGADAETVKNALIRLNDRIRNRSDASGAQSMVMVYYSGHADSEALHLNGTSLPIEVLEQLVRGSSAYFRILILDACRSGALTRVKGMQSRAAPFSIQIEEKLPAEGVAFLTSSSAHEDAQESDELQGSFFTHYLVSGLMGAADRNENGKVVLGEAYQYAYENTLRASSRSLAGTQHPTFHYELRGKEDAVLTFIGDSLSSRALAEFPPGRTYLVFSKHDQGPVVAEVGAYEKHRKLSLKPGRYFVRGRGRDYLLEGPVLLEPGKHTVIKDSALNRVAYARLIRKGRGVRSYVHGPQAGYWARTALANSRDMCHGGFLGYRLDLEHLGISSRIGFCKSGFSNETLSSSVNAVDWEFSLFTSFDLPWVSVEPGISSGAVWFYQDFSTPGEAPPRVTLGALVSAYLGLSIDLPAGFYLTAQAAAQTHFFRIRSSGETTESWKPSFGIQTSFAVGKHL